MSKGVHSKKEQHKAHVVLVVIALVVVGLIGFEISPIGGNVAFYSEWVRCGHKPTATAAADGVNSKVMYYFEPSSLPGTHPTRDYFCTPLEAEIAGYSANMDRYDFPHINAQ